ELKNKILRIRYTGTTGETAYDSYDEPQQVGNYTATVEINTTVAGSANYKLKASSSNSAPIHIGTNAVTLPSVTNEAGDVDSWYTYGDSSNGEYYYVIDGYDPTKMQIEIASGYEGKFTWDETSMTVLATEAGIYTNALKVSLLNAYDKVTGAGRNVWDESTNDSTDKFLSFTINKMELKIDFVTDDGTIHVPIGNSCSVRLRFTSKPLNSSDKIDLAFTATSTRAGSTPIKVFEKYEFTKASPNLVDITFDISSIKVAGSYTVGVVASDINYNVTMTRPITLSLDRSSQSQDLVWWLWENGAESASQNAAVGATDVNLTAATLTYDKNKSYAVHATAPFGYTLDGIAETTLDGSVSVLSSVQDAGNYVTTVKIKKDGQNTTTTYTLRWTIAKAKFDLSSVKWTGDGKLEYNGQEQHPTINAATLPDGLEVDEINDLGGKDVDAYGTASVTFKLASGYENNYLLPVSGGKGTNYDFAGDDDFEWLKPWEIIPAVLKLEWSKQDITDDNTGNEFSVYGLKDPIAEGKVEYIYYLSDVNGKKPADGQTALSIDDLKADYSATDKKYYLAYPSIRSGYDKNYTFPNGTADYSPVFSVGGGSDSVKVELSTDKYEYNRKPVKLKLNIVGAATLSQLALTYYSGNV
ncbi:MAG: hypothetical protein K2N18_06010, partial [Clostridia bacterium]|nr:hypothetical protein [Clostridia bacterium]